MRRWLPPFLLAALLLLGGETLRAQAFGEITSPAPGSTLRGVISVQGSASHSEFWKYEVHAAPGANSAVPDNQWIRLAVREQTVNNGQLAAWDTNTVPDGPYTLRLRVVRTDGNWEEFGYRNVTVTNRAPPTQPPPPPPPPTEPPPPTAPPATPTAAASPTPAATATPGPTETPAATPTVGPSPTAPPVSTLAPSDGEPGASPTVEAQATLAADATATSPPINPPPIAVARTATATSDEGAGGALPGPTPPASGGSTTEESLSLGELFDVTTLAGACFTGAGLAALFFLLAGLVYLLRLFARLVA